jgi:magnesium transporter
MLINCVAYQDGKKLADLPTDKISDYIARPECFVWVALRDAEPDELSLMQQEFGLHELAVEDARRGHQRPKIEEYGESLFTVVKTVELVEGELIIGEVDIFVGRNYVLSVRSQSSQGFLGVRARAENEPEMLRQGPAFVLYALMDAVVDRYFPVVDALESELDQIEERIFDKGTERDNIQRLYELKRKITLMRHAVGPLIEAVDRLHGPLYRINGQLYSIRDTISTAIQVNLSMVAIDESEVNKQLAAYAAIFAVFTGFAGIWGMNFKFMPELEWHYGYPMAIGVMVLVCGYMYSKFKRSGWL